jgi:hypothetical protein
LQQLSEQLQRLCPNLPLVEFCELLSSEQDNLPAFFRKPRGGFPVPESQTNPLDDKLVFVFCARDDPVAQAARRENPQALWGAAVRGDYALAWTPGNRFLLWHEAMHLLFANDCYDESGNRTCDEARCIMQYEPCEENCGGDLYLCHANVQRVTAHYAAPGGAAGKRCD